MKKPLPCAMWGNLVAVTSDIEKYAAFARKINADRDYSQPLLDSSKNA